MIFKEQTLNYMLCTCIELYINQSERYSSLDIHHLLIGTSLCEIKLYKFGENILWTRISRISSVESSSIPNELLM
jgi:hypothetical protein